MASGLNALNGALVADAAAMGLHWMYDQQHMRALAALGDVLFRSPDANLYQNRKSYFAHAGKLAGDLSHYGASLRLIADLALAADGFSVERYHQSFMTAFGPCGRYSGFSDRPTKALVATLLGQPDGVSAPTGSDDTQMPALAFAPALFAGDSDCSLKSAVESLSTNDVALAGAQALYECLQSIAVGQALRDALVTTAERTPAELGQLMRDALEFTADEYTPFAVTQKFGMPCHMVQGLPVAWCILNNTQNYADAARDNVLACGDSCGRAMAIGSIAGLVYGVPDSLTGRMAEPLYV